MNRTLLTGIALAACSVAMAQGGWKNPATMTATVREQFSQAAPREMTLTKKGDDYSFRTSYEINGMLGGTERIEIAGPKGFYTWLPGRPDVVLRLWSPTSLDVFDFLAKPRFSRADLEVYLEGIERALGKKVLVGKSEQVSGRDCLVLTILDTPGQSADYQRLWIDRETGVAMKLQDVVRGTTEYEREITKISFDEAPADMLFAPKPEAKILSGIVLPTVLTNFGSLQTGETFSSDVASLNQRVGKTWAGATNNMDAYGYAGSSFRTVRNQSFNLGPDRVDPRQAERDRRRQARGNMIAQQRQFVVSDDRTVMLAFATESSGGGEIAVIHQIEGTLPPTVEIEQSRGGGQREGGPGGSTSSGSASANSTVTYPMVQSDFVDAKTGATLTLLQIEGRDLKPWLSPLMLDEGVPVGSEGAGNARFHTSSGPVKASVLTWKLGQSNLALVSTSLGKDELVKIASRIQTGR